MHCRHVLPQTLVKPQYVVSRPLAPLPSTSGHKQYTTVAHAAAAEEAAADKKHEQPTAEQQQIKGKAELKARIKRLASSSTDKNTSNTGLISVTNKSVASSAAARVVADLKAKGLTRIVACSSADIPKAINVINIATQMVNGQNSNASEQQLQEQQADTAVPQQVLLFQPVRVDGVLVAPPALPAGAAALYTYMLPTGNKALQAAMAKRAELRAAAAAAASSSSDDASSSSSRRLSADDGFVSVNSTSNARGVARAIVESIRTRGWAELTSYGGPLATQQAVEALMSARGLLYKQSKLDVAAVFLEFWKKESKVAAGASQQSGVSAEHATAGQRQQQGQGHAENIQPLPFRCATFLLVACAKNKPLQLVVPPPPPQQQQQQQPQ